MPDPQRILVGGSFAPPLTDEKLAKYKKLADALEPSPVKDAMLSLLKCCEKWWELPEPNGTKSEPHPATPPGRKFKDGTPKPLAMIVSLQDDHAKALWDLIPWEHELEAYDKVLDTIPNDSQKELRDAAFHLLWHVKELNLDREPLTTDKF